mgnify:CR=1 FL=1
MKRFLLCVVFLLSCLFLHMASPVWANAVFDDCRGKYFDEGRQMTLQQMRSCKHNGTYAVKYYDSYFGTWIGEYYVLAMSETSCTIEFYAYIDGNSTNKVYVGYMRSSQHFSNGKANYTWNFYSSNREEIADEYRESTGDPFPDELPVFQLFFGEQE